MAPVRRHVRAAARWIAARTCGPRALRGGMAWRSWSVSTARSGANAAVVPSASAPPAVAQSRPKPGACEPLTVVRPCGAVVSP